MTGQSENTWIRRAIATGSVSGMMAFAWTHAILPWGIPLATPLIVGLVARAQGLLWTETIVYALVAFASITVGLLRFDEWRERRRVAGKLVLTDPMIGVRRQSPEVGPASALKFGFNLISKAVFPIEFRIDSIRTHAGNLHNANPIYHLRDLTIPETGTAFFWDDEIAIEHPIIDRQVDCRIETGISYGRRGNLKYALIKKWVLHVKFDENGLPLGISQWSEIK